MVKTTTLGTIKVKVKKDGTLTEKSLKEIQGLTKEAVGDKLIRKLNVQGVTHGLTFIGLTVGVRYGLIDPLSGLMGIGWRPGAVVGGLMEDLGEGLRTAFGEENDKQRSGKLFELMTLRAFRDEGLSEEARAVLEARIKGVEETLRGIPGEGSEEETLGFDKWLGEHTVAIEWFVSMGLAGLAIKLAEHHTVTDIIELLPGQ